MLHLGHPDLSARYNPVGSFSRSTEVATGIAGKLPSEGLSAAFKDFVWTGAWPRSILRGGKLWRCDSWRKPTEAYGGSTRRLWKAVQSRLQIVVGNAVK